MCQAVPTESLALSWYVLTTALQFSIRTIEYLFFINHQDLFLNLSDTCPIKSRDVSKGCHCHKNVRKTFRHTCSHTRRTSHVVFDFPRCSHSDLRDWNKTFRRQLWTNSRESSLLPFLTLSIDPVDPRSGKTRPQVFPRSTVDTGP